MVGGGREQELEGEAVGLHGGAAGDTAAAARADRRQDRGGRPVRHVGRQAAADQEGIALILFFYLGEKKTEFHRSILEDHQFTNHHNYSWFINLQRRVTTVTRNLQRRAK